MQTNFQVQWLPLPVEHEAEWRYAIELIARNIKNVLLSMNDESGHYRLVWRFGEKIEYGMFLFDSPADAWVVAEQMKMLFLDIVIWLEDRNGKKIERNAYEQNSCPNLPVLS